MTIPQKITSFIRAHRVDIALAAGIFIIAAVPRLLDLGTFLTADEKNWLVRSYEFVRAFKDFRFNDMLQTTHPGVTTLWLSGLAITAKMYASHTIFTSAHLAAFLRAAQLPIAFANTAAVPLTYLFLRRLLGQRLLPAVAALLIALDPLLIGYSRVAHVDGLLASLLFLAALALLIYFQSGYSRHWLIISAILSALAMLTKIPAIFIIPFFLLAIVADGKKTRASRPYLRERSRDVVMWGMVIVVLFIMIWPAIMWVPDPAGNAHTVTRDLAVALGTPHDMTESYTLNPWHYPLALLTRTTPVAFFFGVVALVVLVSPTARQALKGTPVRVWWLIVAYIVFFIAMMTLGAKKGDRYILPVWPAIDTLAALGLIMASRRIAAWLGRGRQQVLVAMLFLTFLSLLWPVYTYHPYAIAYSNPLFPDNLSQELGWGEGLDQVAAWLNKNYPAAVVASWYPEELGAFTTARVAHINAHEQTNVQFIVLYRNMFGRSPDHPANDFIDEYYKKREPVYVAYVHGKEFAWVYAKHVYEKVVGELLPGKRLSQRVEVQNNPLSGFEVSFATYSGRATAGSVRVTAVSADPATSGAVLGQWEVPVQDISDTKPHAFSLAHSLHDAPQLMDITIQARGTAPGNAPTVRYTKDFIWRNQPMRIDDAAAPGNLAVRVRYQAGDQVVTEDDTLLLKKD